MASTDPRGGVVRVTVFEEPADDEVADAKARSRNRTSSLSPSGWYSANRAKR